ncbi:MAG TPA: 4'-phosphopantetheinyl transferase superfamily protein [Candidatus Rubrimentiphilum sp.]|nr:4'-phosphopantetheinyl transferase superfamily protein [Candidatus Rubrimentiphilum sp.]
MHVWTVRLDAARRSEPLHVLSRDERDRAARYSHERTRRNFAVRRSALRLILGSYAGLSPSAVLLTRVPGEKPFFVNSPAPAIQYSASSSEALAVFAVTQSGRVGIDIESVGPFEGLRDVAQDVFAPGELAAILSEEAEAERLAAFFSAWTRKEAVVKCEGRGVLGDLRLVNAPAFGGGLHDLDVAQGYAAAIACEQPSATVIVLDGPLTLDELATKLAQTKELAAV